ncbi:hypothetical protein ABW20_dc0105825 [Dactylellina cionopaga]|nr:hypothetical protein ABW20_dc0105825 [Dactylellina cionopaga]
MSTDNKPADPMAMQRGNYNWTPTGPLLLIAGRALSLPVQYLIITGTTSLRMPYLPAGLIPFLPPSLANIPSLTLPQTLMLAMPAYIAFKHSYWSLFILREPMTVPFAFFGGLSNLAFESLTSYIFTLSSRGLNPTWSPSLSIPGAILNFVGITTEIVSEIQRARFKREPKNEGKVYTEGLWSLVRNGNYTCNLVFSFGYALAAGGPLYACAYSGIYLSNFVFNAIPAFEEYMRKKYGGQWEGVVEGKVRWRLCPGIY